MQRHVKQTEAGAKLDGQPAEPFVERPEDDAAAVDEPSKPKREPRASSWLPDAETQLSYAIITAPISGHVGFRQVDAATSSMPETRPRSRCSPISHPRWSSSRCRSAISRRCRTPWPRARSRSSPWTRGNAQAFQDSLSSEPVLIAAALVVVYLILGMLYESFIHPLTILSTLPSAGVGALLALMAGGFDLSVIGIIGIILLIGIVKKNGIMLVDFAIQREREGGLPHEAIREACLLRFRPILMTTMAAMLGGVPLMLGHGAGSELRQPLGYAMVGGLALSQVLTLYTTP